MGTLNLGNNGIINGVVKKPLPYLLCQSNTSVTINNQNNTLLTHFGNTRVSQGGLLLTLQMVALPFQLQVYIEFVPEYVMTIGF